jgi:hypothetical protein
MTILFDQFLSRAELADITSRTGSIDILPKLLLALSCVQTSTENSTYPVTPTIQLPLGVIYLNGTLNLNTSVHIQGHGRGQQGGSLGTVLRFPANTTGIRPCKGGTSTQGADGSIFERLFIKGGGGTDVTAHGIDVQTRIVMRDMTFCGFRGNGVNIVDDSARLTNANNWSASNIVCLSNGGHGWYTQGGDANAGVASMIDATGNGGWGIYDSSFLGSTYLQCHTASNALGPYKTDNPNGRNQFIGCYSESDQQPSSMVAPTLVIGGLHGAGFTPASTACIVSGRSGYLNSGAFRTEETTSTGKSIQTVVGGDANNGQVLQATHQAYTPNGSFKLRWDTNLGGLLRLDYNNIDSLATFGVTSPTTTFTGGRSDPVVGAFIGQQLFVGNLFGNGARQITAGSAPPISGNCGQGDMCINNAATAGGFAGWICVAAGTPGTWKTFGAISP